MRTILACDDEAAVLQLIRVNLERAGYRVVTATNGREALERIAEASPDLAILDVMMPYKDGFTVLQEIRSNPRTSLLPVILLTARSSDADTVRGWQEGADSYLTKPFNPKELLTFVDRLLRSAGRPTGAGDEAKA